MKHIKAFLLVLLTISCLNACWGGSGNDSTPTQEPEPSTYQRTLQLSAAKGQQTYTASDLRSGISNIDNQSSWLTVTPMAYSSGSPNVQLIYDENTGNERQAVVTLTSTNGDRVILTVTQAKGTKTDYGIDDTHNDVTDQPAYSR